MRKINIISLMAFFVFLTGCANEQIACTADAKICPDGSAVGRSPPDCEFEGCPTEKCDYKKPGVNYIGKSADECSTIKFMCEQNSEPFEDRCGCGCRLSSKGQNGQPTEVFCTPGQRDAEACVQIYQPVCGWFDPQKVQCARYPCAQTYSNSCFACMDSKVVSWTEGECQE